VHEGTKCQAIIPATAEVGDIYSLKTTTHQAHNVAKSTEINKHLLSIKKNHLRGEGEREKRSLESVMLERVMLKSMK